MKLQLKLSLFNAFTKAAIFALVLLIVPYFVEHTSIAHTDKRLHHMKSELLRIADRVGFAEFLKEESDSSFSSYNILKEEFIALSPCTLAVSPEKTENTQRRIENEVVDYRVLSEVIVRNGKHYQLEVGKSLAAVDELDATLRRFSIVTTIVILLLMFIVNMGFTNYLLRPFRLIVEKKLKTAGHPDSFNFDPVKTSTDDFRYLDRSINEMMEKVREAFLKEKEFIANASHELLTPISILQTRLENLLSDRQAEETINEETERWIIESQQTLGRLTRIVRALLLISKVENDQFLKTEETDLCALLHEVKEAVEDRLEEKQLSLTIRCPENTILFHANHELLFTMFFNLVNNALKYNRPNGSVVITCSGSHNDWRIDISDTGIGIPAEQLQNIFNRFHRVRGERNEGYGLGLSIVKSIATFHGLRLTVESTQGKGSTFSLHYSSAS